MRPLEERRDRENRLARLAEEQAKFQPVAKSPAQIAKGKRLYAEFCASYDKASTFIPSLDPELVAQVPDNPSARERMGTQE
ncbi:hypothetical protein ACHMW7_16080 [Aminobacter sp. UC22_36]|uniref:hypothetical protein n=1 Tax=Aminobacter sp. UC22_36 TaxID=3374549 RepID=UPI0037574633